jgi:predicted N-acyltransferase
MEDSINKDKSEKPKNFLQRAGGSIRDFFVKKAVFNVLLCGNLLLTGKHGYYFLPGIDENISAEIVRQTFDLTQSLLEKEQGKKIHIHMFKDYPCKEKDAAIGPVLKKSSYHSYTIQPAMYMRLPERWKNFDDYLEEMQSKYRVRARRAAKKGEELQKRSLNLSEIEAFNDEIYALYKGIASNVGFNAFTLHPNYFLNLKKHLGDKFQLIGFFLEGKMVAFCTCIFNGMELEAHFLGLDHNVNREYLVYLNILYSIIDMAIYYRMHSINFARTALEIKSSVGAVPCDLSIYLRHRNRISSSVIKFVFEKLTPEEDWQPRSPFKDMDIVK